MKKEEKIESQSESSSIRKEEAQEIAKMLSKEKLTTGDRVKLIKLLRDKKNLSNYIDYAFEAGRISEYEYCDLVIKLWQDVG